MLPYLRGAAPPARAAKAEQGREEQGGGREDGDTEEEKPISFRKEGKGKSW